MPKMKNNLDFSKVMLSSQMVGESDEETALLSNYLDEAVEYINFYNWHSGIKESNYSFNNGRRKKRGAL